MNQWQSSLNKKDVHEYEKNGKLVLINIPVNVQVVMYEIKHNIM